MRPREHRLRLGVAAGVMCGALLLGACTRDSGPTATPTGRAATPSVNRSATPSASRPSSAPSAPANSPAPASSQPPAAPSSQPPAASSSPPASTASQKYVVQPGDTLSAIAQKFGVTTQQLIETNKLSNPDFLTVGQELTIPGR